MFKQPLMRARGAAFVAALSAAAFLGAGCQGPRFVRTDDGFAEQQRETPPDVFLDQKPPRAFRQVGIIEVVASADTPVPDAAQDARERGQRVGCDVLIAKELLDQNASSSFPWHARIQLVHEGHGDGAPRERPQSGPSNESSRTERGQSSGVDRGGQMKKFVFVCGIYEAKAARGTAASL